MATGPVLLSRWSFGGMGKPSKRRMQPLGIVFLDGGRMVRLGTRITATVGHGEKKEYKEQCPDLIRAQK